MRQNSGVFKTKARAHSLVFDGAGQLHCPHAVHGRTIARRSQHQPVKLWLHKPASKKNIIGVADDPKIAENSRKSQKIAENSRK